MKYTHEERLEIGRRIYTGEISKYQAAAEYEINYQTARNYMRNTGIPTIYLRRAKRQGINRKQNKLSLLSQIQIWKSMNP